EVHRVLAGPGIMKLAIERAADRLRKRIPEDLAQELFGRLAKQGLDPAIARGEAPARIQGEKRVGDTLQDVADLPVRALDGLLVLLAARDVARDAEGADRLPGLVAQWHARSQKPAHPAIGGDVLLLLAVNVRTGAHHFLFIDVSLTRVIGA